MGIALAPANGKGAGVALVKAGAREVYWGFHDDAWTRRFGSWTGVNRMSGFGSEANSLTFRELLAQVRAVRAFEANTPSVRDAVALGLYCTFNAPHYSSEQRRFIEHEYLPALAEAGLSGIIVSQPDLIASARDAGLSAVASTMCAVYNEALARFYVEAGARRIILPRDMTLDEIEAVITAVPEASYEVFLMRNGCMFADSHCLGLHRAGHPSLCRSLRACTWQELPAHDAANAAERDALDAHLQRRIASGTAYRERFHLGACGQCALWRLERAGVAAYKVVGRCDRLDELKADVALTAANIAIARACETQDEYWQHMRRPTGLRALCAEDGLSCYYPDVRVPSRGQRA